MLSRRRVPQTQCILSVVWLLALLASASTNYHFPASTETMEDIYEPQSVRDLEALRSLLTGSDLTIEYKAPISVPVDFTVKKRYGFPGLDNLDVIHRVMDSRKPETLGANRESKYSLRQLMERHG